MDVILDSADNMYIGDTYNNRIRKISSDTITTIAGNGTLGYSGDGGSPLSAELNRPIGIAVDAIGNIYVADVNNYRVRIICSTNCPAGVGDEEFSMQYVSIWPNPASSIITIEAQQVSEARVCDVLGANVRITSNKQINVSDLAEGIYFVRAQTPNGVFSQKIVIKR
jgi:hypothetical protein